jgi:hypothetical protein
LKTYRCGGYFFRVESNAVRVEELESSHANAEYRRFFDGHDPGDPAAVEDFVVRHARMQQAEFKKAFRALGAMRRAGD